MQSSITNNKIDLFIAEQAKKHKLKSISTDPKHFPLYLRMSKTMRAQIDSVRHHGHRGEIEVCVMLRRFIEQAERVIHVHGNHESVGDLKEVVQ
jgi:hypothetical protein